ncbi:MAG: two-component regulator propeller domain-containing protein [Bacteroidia bacterium]|nr:two-component regulator propeller domain-containing protein [Bacteroidia bacterium]
MCRFYTLLLLIIFVFFSCDKKHGKQKKDISFSPPVSIIASNPIVTIVDTCPKPNIIIYSSKDSSLFTIQTHIGPQTGHVYPIKTIPLLAGEAGGYSFMQNFNTEQGLGLSTIVCSYKDRAGNLWFGTAGGGVSKYDGNSFTNFTTSQGLANNLVNGIREDKAGNMWFATNGGGVSKYDGKCFTNFTTIQGLVNNKVLCITEDKSGNLWFGTDGGICKYDQYSKKVLGGKFFVNYTTEQGLISNHVAACITDKKGNLWFGTNKGVSKYNPSIKGELSVECFTNYTKAQGMEVDNIKRTYPYKGFLFISITVYLFVIVIIFVLC